jgi:hypothetical protein
LAQALIALEKSLLDFIKENCKETFRVLEEVSRGGLTNIEKRRILGAISILAKDFNDCERYELTAFRDLIEHARVIIAAHCKLLLQEKKRILPNAEAQNLPTLDNNEQK